MSRQLVPAAEITGPDLVTQSPADVLHAPEELSALQAREDEIARKYGYERFDRSFIENQVWAAAECIARRQYEAGASIQMLAEIDNLPIQRVCEILQINRAFGHQCVRFHRLVQQAPSTLTFARRNSVNAALELAVLPADEADKIMRDCLDDIDPTDRMTVKEVRALVRKQRDLLQAKDELIVAKDSKINTLDRELRTWKKSEAKEKAEKILFDAQIAEVSVKTACNELENAVRRAMAEYGESQTPLDDETRAYVNELVAKANAHTARLNILVQR